MPTAAPREGPGAREPWQQFADALLFREVLRVRFPAGAKDGDLPGLLVDLERPNPRVDEALGMWRERFHRSLEGDSRFASIAHSARLDSEEAEVLALLAAVELDGRRERLAVYAQDSIHLPRISLGSLERLFPPTHPGPRAVAPDARLIRSCLVEVEEGGPWVTRMAYPASRVAWALAGDDSNDPALPIDARVHAGQEGAGREALVLVVGPDRATRLREAFARCGGSGFLVTTAPGEADAWRAVVREATVRALSVVLELDGEPSGEARFWMERAGHLAWAVCSSSELALERLPDRRWVEVHVDDGRATEEDWLRAFGRPDDVGRPLGREQVRLAGLAARGLDGDVEAAVRRLASGHLDALAVQIRPRRGWGELG